MQHGPTQILRNAKLLSERSQLTGNQPSISKMTEIKSARKNRIKGGKLQQSLTTVLESKE